MALQQAAFVAPGVAPQAPFAPSAHPVAAPVTQDGAESSSSFSMAAGGLVPVAALAMAGRARKGRRGQKARRGATLTQPPKLGKGFDTDTFSNVCDQTGITLARYVIEMQKQGLVDSEIALIMNSIREAVKVIAALVRKAPLKQAELLGLEGNINVQGEDQKKLDVITNDVLKNALRYTGKLGTMASEEEDAPVIGGEGVAGPVNQQVIGESGSYVCVFDPLDGSSNVDAGVPVGTIFGIFKEDAEVECTVPDTEDLSPEEVNCLAQTLQPGKNLVAAGYCFYSSSTELVVTFGHGTAGFTLDNDLGDFKLTRPSIKIPERGSIYSVNQANERNWDQPMQDYINALQNGKGETGKPYSLRYIGSMVGDVHRTLLYGGVFAYPADAKNQDGKLRLLYEAAPMSFIVEQAGGKSITGHSRVMDIPPVAVHQRVPVVLGSPEDIDECYKFYDNSDDASLRERCEKRLSGASA